MASRLSNLGYSKTRRLILIAGLLVLGIVVALMLVRRVQTVEVIGTLLFIPIFLAFVFKGVRGGVIAGLLAAVAYAAMRYPAIDLVGFGKFAGLILSRSIAFLAFGTIGGLASSQLESSIQKLDLFDEIDDLTGLYNARFFIDNTGLEISRSARYQTMFCTAVVDVPTSAFNGISKRQKDKIIKELADLLKESVRTVDRAVHAADDGRHRFAAILPETARDGGRVFTGRLVTKMVETMNHRGVEVTEAQVPYQVSMFPGDDEDIQQLRREFTDIEAREHPETAHSA